ncbi:MAG: polysaccharide biosynthesis protein, partial [Clostridia bacterium]|nr:polysaccharide biosynthesis protein [Clostridia bacterium]
QGLVSAEHLAIPWGFRKNGASASQALASYGTLHGMVYPLVFFPSAVLGAFAGLLVPEFAEFHARGDRERIRTTAAKVMRLSLLFSIGVAGIFISFAYQIGTSLYPGTDAPALLARIAPLIPVMYLDSAVDSMLKGLGEQLYCMRVNIIDSLCCLILVVILIPRFGLGGYFLVQYLCELLNATLSIGRLVEVTDLRPQVGGWVFYPLLSVIGATSAVRLLSAIPAVPLIGAGGSPAARIAAAILLYCLFVLAPMGIGKRNRRARRTSVPA